MFGVGTDYCLLLVSRYREELRRIEDKHEAMARALRRTGPTILASGLTVSLAMLTLVLADARLTSTLGPVAAIGVACGMVAGLTLLPALLTIFGRRGFWPRRSVVEYDPRARDRESPGRVAADRRSRPAHDPALALTVTVIVFVAGALGLLAYKVDYSTTTFFKKSVESVEGFELHGAGVPGRRARADHGPGRSARTARSTTIDIANVATAPRGRRRGRLGDAHRRDVSTDGSAATIDLVLEDDPYTKAALNVVPEIARRRRRPRPPG